MLSNNSRPAGLPSFCKSSSLPLLKRLSSLFCPVSKSPLCKTAILPSSWILSTAHKICLLLIQDSPDTTEEHVNKNYVKLSQMKYTWWRGGFCRSLPAYTATSCHCSSSDTILLGMQTECSIMEHTADFAGNKMQPVNKLQCHTLISCCCHIVGSPSLSTCDFVGSSLKTSKSVLAEVWLLWWTYSWSVYMLSSNKRWLQRSTNVIMRWRLMT